MVFYFGLFLPLIFAATSILLTKKEQLFVSLISSFSILLLFHVGLLLNRTIGILNFLDYTEDKYFSGLESPVGIAIIVVLLLFTILSSVFAKRKLTDSLTPLSLSAAFLSLFFITAFISTNNIMIFLFACESFIWCNLYQVNKEGINSKALYLLSSVSTAILLTLTIFLGLLENIFLAEMTYSLENLNKISLSYVSGTIYSTQTVFYFLALLYFVLRSSFLLQTLTLIFFERKTKNISSFLVCFGLPALLFCFYTQQSEFYSLVCEEYGQTSLMLAVGFLILIYIYSFKNQFSSWSSKWTD